MFPRVLGDRPRPALEVSTAEVECFSDYMTLQIPSSRVQGLRRWLGRILHSPGSWRTPERLDSLLAQCGFFLHPTFDGDFIFQVQYSACFVQKEKANYRLDIRIFHKGVKRSEWSDGYIMKCPATASGPSRQDVRCGPLFIEVSRPLPLKSKSGQTPWLLSLRGELVASLEDASLMGLYVDINATTVTIQSPRQELLQRKEVLNTSVELLPLWLVSGHYAYSLEAACPLGSSQPDTEVSVHIPKQRLGLVKRGSRIEESLNLKSLHAHQSDSFTVTESREFVVVSIPAAVLLQVQPCQQARGAPGTQAFYKVDLSLEFAEVAAPVLWTVENIFQCMGGRLASASFVEGSGTELPASTARPRPPASSPPAGLDTPPAGLQSAPSSLFQDVGPGAQEGPWQGPAHWSSGELAKQEPRGLLRTARPAGGSWASTASLLSRAVPVSPRWSPWGSAPPKVFLGSEPSVTLTEGPGPTRPEQEDPTQPSGGSAASTEPIQGEPAQASKEFQPLMRHPEASPAGDTSVSRYYLKLPQETLSVTQSKEPPQSGHVLSQEGARGHLGLLAPEPSQVTEGPGRTLLPGVDAIFITPRGQRTDTRAPRGTSERHELDPAAPLTALVENPLASSSEEPAASFLEGSVRAPNLESNPKWPVSRCGSEAARTSSPYPLQGSCGSPVTPSA
ncbi:uncharacterized protein C1orf127 homolog isoform X2 [Sciurus carolinensis]|uniref:uncharacterized protein C1orf127 homolog isoform X2 n=1 Tax=Sciurus carolinensis TaxID=30640 RepID=UPI001FB353AA|nr:uncharacterized protein C1orf127 homolog isoform X2 [Sciurus carolinensis]